MKANAKFRLNQEVDPDFLMDGFHVIFANCIDLKNFAGVDFGVWRFLLCCKLRFANFSILTDSKYILDIY